MNRRRAFSIVVPVLMTSCHVSDQPKSGPETAHKITTATASTNVDERPTCRSTQRAKREKSGVGHESVWERRSARPDMSNSNEPTLQKETRKGGAGSVG